MAFYHYTCSHAAPRIQQDGELKPHRQIVLGDMELVWFTDLDLPDQAALGLTSHTLRCDRTEWRVTVDGAPVPWVKVARQFPAGLRRRLEFTPGARPMHWYVATGNVPVVAVERVSDLISAPLVSARTAEVSPP